MKNFFYVLLFLIVLLFSCLQCQSDFNITKKELGCQKLDRYNSMACCMQLISSKTGNDSKDSVCSPLVLELVDLLKEERQKRKYLFCKSEPDFQKCLDKLNLK